MTVSDPQSCPSMDDDTPILALMDLHLISLPNYTLIPAKTFRYMQLKIVYKLLREVWISYEGPMAYPTSFFYEGIYRVSITQEEDYL